MLKLTNILCTDAQNLITADTCTYILHCLHLLKLSTRMKCKSFMLRTSVVFQNNSLLFVSIVPLNIPFTSSSHLSDTWPPLLILCTLTNDWYPLTFISSVKVNQLFHGWLLLTKSWFLFMYIPLLVTTVFTFWRLLTHVSTVDFPLRPTVRHPVPDQLSITL